MRQIVLVQLLALLSTSSTLGQSTEQQPQPQDDALTSQNDNYSEEDLFYWDPADDVYWDELSPDRRAYYTQVGWTRRMWDSGEDAYFQFSWEEHNKEVQRALITLGWTQETWDEDDNLFQERWNVQRDLRRDRSTQVETQLWKQLSKEQQEAATLLGYDCDTWPAGCSNAGHSTGLYSEFDPTLGLLRNLSLAPLNRLDLSYFASLAGTDGDVEVELTDGTTVGDDEYCERKRGYTLSRYAHDLLTRGYSTGGVETNENSAGATQQKNFYLKYEDYDPFKIALMRTVGTTVIQTLSTTLSSSEQLRSNRLWAPEYDRVRQFDNSNWVVWVGGEGTSTSMHYDDDEFNFIYVAQGRKKVVILPNDKRTNGKYACLTEVDGHSCWTGVDLLNVSSSTEEQDTWSLPEYATEIIVEAGDGIVIPHLSWHAVLNLEPTVAYGFRINAFQYEDNHQVDATAAEVSEADVVKSYISSVPAAPATSIPASNPTLHDTINKNSENAQQKGEDQRVEDVAIEEGSWDRVTAAVRDAAKYLGYDESSDWSSLHKIQL